MGSVVGATNWRPGQPAPPGYLVIGAGTPDERLTSQHDWDHRNDSQDHGALVGLADSVGEDLADIGRNLPVVGDLMGEKPVDPASFNTGLGYYGKPDEAFGRASDAYGGAGESAQDLYNRALGRSATEYKSGQLGAVDLQGADRLVGQQDSNLGRLDQAAAGKGPSAAQSQYNAALGQARGQAMALANTSRGAGRGAARLQALSNFGAQAGVQAETAAALRAQEQMAAQQAYTGALAGARGQDQSLATTGAQLRLQRDVGQEAANRGAYDSTQEAQRGMLGVANAALGQRLGAAGGLTNVAQGRTALASGQAGAQQARYELAMGERDRVARRHAANRQGISQTFTTAAEF